MYISAKFSNLAGSAYAVLVSFLIVLLWACMGPITHFSENWQIIINTITSVITFLMVFLIQSAQNRDTKAIHIKLDELIRALKTARNEIADIEESPYEELVKIKEEMTKQLLSEQK